MNAINQENRAVRSSLPSAMTSAKNSSAIVVARRGFVGAGGGGSFGAGAAADVVGSCLAGSSVAGAGSAVAGLATASAAGMPWAFASDLRGIDRDGSKS